MQDCEIIERILLFDAGPPPMVNGNLLTDEEGNLIANDIFVDINSHHITIAAVHNMENIKKWVIRNGSMSLSKAGDFLYEPMPSSRTDEFVEETRFASLEDAVIFLNDWRRTNFHKFVAVAKNNSFYWGQVKDKLKENYDHISPEIETRGR